MLMKEPLRHDDRLLAALAYPLWYVVFIVVYLSPRRQKSRFLRYHAYQGLFLGLTVWVGGILLWTAADIAGKIFILFGLLAYPLLKLLQLAAFAVTAWATLMAWLGKWLELPFITEFARPFVDEGEPTE